MDNSVGNLAKPSSKNLPFARTNRTAVLNFHAAVAATPAGPSRLAHSGRGLDSGGCASGCAHRPQMLAAGGTAAPQAGQNGDLSDTLKAEGTF
jgi:hypothetical protein